MPEALFYELLTCAAAERAMLFRKIGVGENPLSLTANGGFLFGRELEFGRPTQVIRDSALNNVRWIFNAGLRDPEWAPRDSLQDLDQWQADMARQVNAFRERAGLTAHAFFPELRDVPGKQVHQPWKLPGGPPAGYPEPMVDHKEERLAALELRLKTLGG